MHPTTYHELAHMHQSELMREAKEARLAKEARQAKAAAADDKLSVFAGLRSAVGSLMHAVKPAKAGSLTNASPSSI